MGKKYNEKYDNAVGPEIGGELPKEDKWRSYRIGACILITIATLAGFQVATQYFAAQMSYNSALLGEAIPGAGNIYWFWSILGWYKYNNLGYEEQISQAMTLGMVTFLPFMIIIMLWKFNLSNRLKANLYLHGSSRWANRKDIEKMGLLPHEPTARERLIAFLLHRKIKVKPAEGVFVGAWTDRKTKKTYYLRHNGPQHILCVAPTRSGKGVGLVNPTLLTWKESCFVMDLKGELWALTSGWRKKYAHNKCLRFEPAEPRVCIDKAKGLYNVARWNPLDEIRSEGSVEYYYDVHEKGPHKLKSRICDGQFEAADVQNIATLIVDPDGKGLEDHWAKTAFALLVGAIIHLKHNCPDNCNIHALDLMLAGQIDTAAIRKKNMDKANGEDDDYWQDEDEDDKSSGGIQNLWADMKLGLDCWGKPYRTRETVITAGADMADRPKEEGGSVLSTAKSFLSLYREPTVAANTSYSDFRIKQLMNMEDPVSLYVVTQPTDKGRLKPLVRLLVNLVIRLLADKMEFEGGRSVKGYMHRILLMLDEFPSLGKLDIMQESLAFIAGYGMKAYLIVQDMAQLFTLYGKDESISSNCHISNWYAPIRTDTAEIMSKKIGTTTIAEENVSLSGTGLKTSKSRSMQETQRSLLTPDECMHLPGPKTVGGNITEAGKMIVLVAGFPAIYGTQPLYFQDPVLLDRAKVKAPAASDVTLKDGKSTDTPPEDLIPDQDKKEPAPEPTAQASAKKNKKPPVLRI